MHLRFNFNACPMHSPFGFVHVTHQNFSARALFCLNSLTKVNTQLLIYNCLEQEKLAPTTKNWQNCQSTSSWALKSSSVSIFPFRCRPLGMKYSRWFCFPFLRRYIEPVLWLWVAPSNKQSQPVSSWSWFFTWHTYFSWCTTSLFWFFTVDEVFEALKNLDASKSPEPDEILPVFLKSCCNELSPILCDLFNFFVRRVEFQRLGKKLMWFLFTKVMSSQRMMLVVTALSHWQVFCARLLRKWFLFVSWNMWMSKVFCLIINLVSAVVEIVSKCWSNSFIYFVEPLMIMSVILWTAFSQISVLHLIKWITICYL